MSNTPPQTEEESRKVQSPSLESQQQPEPRRSVSPTPLSLPHPPTAPLPTTAEEPAPSVDPPAQPSDIVDSLLPGASGGHRVGERVLRRSRRTRTHQTTSTRLQASTSNMVRPSPTAVNSDNDSDSDPGSKISQSTAVSDSRPDPELRPRRTRTLTTPHQAAVLNALLAQVGLPFSHTDHLLINFFPLESLPNHTNERGSWPSDWHECEESSGWYLILLTSRFQLTESLTFL